MPEITLLEDDRDLVPLLRACTDEELAPIVEIILDKGWISSELEMTEVFKKYRPSHSKYTDEIAAEIQLFGGHMLMRLMRGHGVPYREVAFDVGEKLKADIKDSDSVETIEEKILKKVVSDTWDRMTDDQKRELWEFVGKKTDDFDPTTILGKQALLAAVIALIRLGGFRSYILAVQITNAAFIALFGRGLAFAANAGMMRLMGVFVGPVGWLVTILWTVIDLSGPAYRVTIPIVLYVATLRMKFKIKRSGFILCGRSGHGKSSLINLIADGEIAIVGHTRSTTGRWNPYEITFADKYVTTVIDTRGFFESTTPFGAITESARQELKSAFIRNNPRVMLHLISAPEVRSMSEDFKLLNDTMSDFIGALHHRPEKILVLTKVDTLGNPRKWPSQENLDLLTDLMRYIADDVLQEELTKPIHPESQSLGLELSGNNRYGYKYIIPVCCREPAVAWNRETLMEECERLIQALEIG